MELHGSLKKLVTLFHENRLAHAFLIETNDVERCSLEIRQLIKMVLCNDTHKETDDCCICSLIDSNTLPTVKIIEPDGSTIKKNQILSLKDAFQSKPVITNYNVYVIKNSEKLNASSANTMLKFLEDPDGDVLGFFITNNKKGMISTIVSRCQFIQINYATATLYERNAITEETYQEYVDLISVFLKCCEQQESELNLDIKKQIMLVFDERKKIDIMLILILEIYRAIYYKKCNIDGNIELITKFSFLKSLSRQGITKRMLLVKEMINSNRYNVNIELLMDKFMIEMRRIND